MKFNMKKHSQTKSYPTMINQYNKDWNLAISEIESYNGLLNADRRLIKEPETQEAMLSKKRNKNAQNKITEMALSDSESKLVSHRNKNTDPPQVTPINALSEAFDAKYRESFAKANKEANEDNYTKFWDSYIGADLEENTKNVSQITEEASQLPNNPNRFENVNELPTNVSGEENRKLLNNKPKIKPQKGFDKGSNSKSKEMEKIAQESFDYIKDSDLIIYNTYKKAFSEKRDINAEERSLIDNLNKDKQSFLLALAQIQDDFKKDNDTDFLDNGNDLTAGDENLFNKMNDIDNLKDDKEESSMDSSSDEIKDILNKNKIVNKSEDDARDAPF